MWSCSTSTPRATSAARSSSSSRVQRPCSASASGRRTRRHGFFRSTSWPAERHLRRPDRLERDLLEHRLEPLHRVAVVGVRLVPLEHRELGVVLVGDALVAEVLRELVHALEPADDEALEVELGGDAEVEVGVELVVVRHERARERAAVARLQHGRLDLDEALGVEVAADRGDHARADEEVRARLLVHQQVEVAAAVARLDVGQAVERVGQRRADLRQERELVDGERGLAAARPRRRADHADDVAEIDVDRARHGSRRRGAGCGRSGRRGRGRRACRGRAGRARGRRAAASRAPPCPGSSCSHSARTLAMSFRSGNRFGSMVRESSARRRRS